MGTRRQYSSEFKVKIVLQALTGEKSGSELCRAHKLNPNLLSRWRKKFKELQRIGRPSTTNGLLA
jgi:transposase